MAGMPLAIALIAGMTIGPTAPRASAPNIIVVLADDLGWSDIGCYGGEIPTPNIDALAKAGLRFTRFYNHAVCGPSRAALLTGLYPQQIGHSGRHWNEPTDFTKCVTLGEVLKSAGYRTMVVGKWQERELPARLGFDRFFGPMCSGKISYFHEVRLNPIHLDTERWTPPADFHLTEAFNDHAVKFVTEALAEPKAGAKRPPFFLYLAHIAPHWPLHAREAEIAPHRKRYRRAGWDELRSRRFAEQRKAGLVGDGWKLGPVPAGVTPWRDDALADWQAERMAVYSAQVASIDAGLGRLMDVVRKAGVENDTLVVFLSDNGAAPDGGVGPTTAGFLKPGEAWRLDGKPIRPGSGPKLMPGPADTFAAYGLAWATLSNAPFRSTKTTAYEGGIRTPMVACWPAVIRNRGGVTGAVGHVMDFMPTLAEIAGATYPARLGDRTPLPLEGRSLLPVFRGQSPTERGPLAWRAPQNRAICEGRWKLVESPATKRWELYDLDADGTETVNLAADHPAVVKDLADKWDGWAKRCGAKP